jgi:hypothetical protein
MRKYVFLCVAAVLMFGLASPAFAATGSASFTSGSDPTTVYGPINQYAAPGDALWGTTGVPAVLCWKHGSWPLIPGSTAQYISNTYLIEGNIAGATWRWYRVTLTLPDNATNIQASGFMKVNSDNADRTWINGTEVGTDGEVEGTSVDNYEWSTVQSYPIPAGAIHAGANYMDVVVRNYAGANTATGNPTGFIYDFSANWTYDLTVDVDIKPGSDPSAFNWDGKGKVPVAVLGSDIFDVYDINPTTVTMAGAAVALKGKKDPTAMASYSDVNFDGYMDLVVQIIDTDGNVIPAGTTEVLVAGNLYDGTYFSGWGDIKLAPQN